MSQLPIWISVFTILASLGLGVKYGNRLYKRGVTLSAHVRTRDLPLIPVSLLSFVALLAAMNFVGARPHLSWYIPQIIDYSIMGILWTLKLFMVAFALTAITRLAWRTRHRYRRSLLVFTILVIAIVEGTTRYAQQPFLPELRDSVVDGVVLQTGASTCAAAACATISRSLGRSITETEMAETLHTSWAGTSPAQIVHGMRSLGFIAKKRDIPSRDLSEVVPPAVLLIDWGPEPDGHAIVFEGGSSDQWLIADPRSGHITYTNETIKANWRGHAIEIGVQSD